MTDQERLEEIETIQNNAYFTYGEVNKAEIDLAEFKWLIQQAEEKIQLEEELEHSTKKEVETSEKLLKAQIENQRYKQALEFYADKKNYETDVVNQWEPIIPVMKDIGEKATQALQGGNDNE